FTSRILPPYMRRSPKVAEVLPVLYLRGLSTGDFRKALAALLGDDAAGLSATNIARLTNECETEYQAFQKRLLDFPAEHWKHLRTSNVIESPFATVRLRQRVTKGAGSPTKGLLMAYKLLDMAQARWRRLDGAQLLPLVREGVVL